MPAKPLALGLVAILFVGCFRTCVSVSAQSRPPVTWVIFVDDLHLDFRNTGRIRDMMKRIVSELIQDGDRFAMVSSGPSTIAVDLTSDRQLLADAIKKTTGNALKYEDIQSTNSLDEVRYRALIAVSTAESILSNASRVPGLTALLFISNGYAITPPDILEKLSVLSATATKSSVRIFAIDPRAAINEIEFVLEAGWPAHLAARQASLRSLADATGGFAIVDGNFVDQLRRINAAVGAPLPKQ